MVPVHLDPVFPLAVLVTVGQKVTLGAALEGDLGGGRIRMFILVKSHKGAVLLRTTGTIWGPRSEFLSNLHQTWHSMRFYTLTDDVKRIFVFVNLNFTPYFEYLWQFGTIFRQNTAK